MPASRASIRQAWARLPQPPPGVGNAGQRVPNTNAWVFKGPDGSFGLMLTGVAPPPSIPTLRHIRFFYRPEKEIEEAGSVRRVTRCFEVHVNADCDQETMARIVERLAEEEPSGRYPSTLLVRTLQDVMRMVEPAAREPAKEAVQGAWGELAVLRELVSRAGTAGEQRAMVGSWEASGRLRDIVDFRLPRAATVLEVKTALQERTHRIHTHAQITVPPDFQFGFLVSIILTETPGGLTCAGLARDIKAALRGDAGEVEAIQTALDRKIDARGAEASDDRYGFTLPADGIALYAMPDIPAPPPTRGVDDVDWTAELAGLTAEPPHIWDALGKGRSPAAPA